MSTSRRGFLRTCGAAGVGARLGLAASPGFAAPSSGRSFHLSVSPDALKADPNLLEVVRAAGVTDVWLTGFLYGHWTYPLEVTRPLARRAEALGLAAHWVNVPLGHPGDSLGAMAGDVPLSPPRRWKPGVAPDGSTYAGTSLHAPATAENAEAVKALADAGVKRVFLDDDFRLARGPGVIGGCFCDEHKRAFLKKTGKLETDWDDLIDAVARRALTPLLRSWVEFTCDDLTACFRAQQKAAPPVDLGIMVMYLGAEKAGIRLSDYRDVPFRVGELMFDDASFAPVKGKTNELFSALFHRRFAAPERAYSETTAYPANRLSARNMAAKLVVSTISDVRHTMFMSGLTAFPKAHWTVLGPAMRGQAALHAKLAGHTPRGPLKHYWGEPSRYVGDDNPYSLFLASGIPFEVVDTPAADGVTFLADADVEAAVGKGRTRLVARPRPGLPGGVRGVPETLPALWALKRELAPTLGRVPFVEEEVPVVCAWYPTARSVLLWNLSERRETLTLREGDRRRRLTLNGLDATLVGDVVG